MKIQHVAIFLMCFGVYQAEGAVLRKSGTALVDFRAAVAGDPDLAAFEASPIAGEILGSHYLSKETYKDKLLNAFIAFKVHTALSAAGHVPVSHSGPNLKLAAEALAADRDNELAEKNALTGRIQTHAGETVAAAVGGGAHFHSDARYLAYGVAERAAGDATGRAAERAIFDATIQRDALGDDITAVYSRTKYNADVAAANAAGNAAGQAAKLAQVNGELATLEAFVRQEETAGRINAAARDAILRDIARVRAAI
jgi:hypothetical protein